MDSYYQSWLGNSEPTASLCGKTNGRGLEIFNNVLTPRWWRD